MGSEVDDARTEIQVRGASGGEPESGRRVEKRIAKGCVSKGRVKCEGRVMDDPEEKWTRREQE